MGRMNKVTKNSHPERQRQPERFPGQRELVADAVEQGVRRYIEHRKAKVPDFVKRHFSFKGTLRLHKKALGKDIYRAPLNMLWIVPTLVVKSATYLLAKAGATKLSEALRRFPAGFATEVQKEINWLIYAELLELPYQQAQRKTQKDALLEEILDSSELSTVITDYLNEISKKSIAPNFRQTLENNLREYAGSRLAASDIATSLISLASGYAAFQQATPGALSGGSAVATAIAQKIAVSQFWLGPSIGAWYYSLFPAAASTGLVVAATGSIIAALALLSTFSGIIIDPVQSKLGLHQRRLYKFLEALEDELLDKNGSPYKIKDIYVTRIFDIIDLLATAVRA